VAGVVGLVASGWGLALRRGASPFVGIASSMLAGIVAGGLLAVAVWIGLNPPWGDPYG